MTIPTTETRDAAPTGLRAFEQITCPFERVRAINKIVRDDCTLPGQLAQLRIVALREGRELTRTVTELATKVGMGRTRVSTLLRHGPDTTRPATVGATTTRGDTAPC